MSERSKHPKIQESIVIFCLGAALGAYSLYSFHTAAVQTSWIMSPYLFPLLLAVFTVLIALSLLLEGLHECAAAEGKAAESGSFQIQKIGVALLLCIAYAALLPHLNFIIATMLFLAAFIWYLGERRVWLVALISIAMPVLLYLIFAVGLSVRLP